MLSTRNLGILASALTFAVLLLLGAILLLGLIVALNGFSDREGAAALLTAVVCQGASLIVAALLAGRLARLLVEKRHWRWILAVITSVLAGTVVFAGAGLVSIVMAIIAAETMRW